MNDVAEALAPEVLTHIQGKIEAAQDELDKWTNIKEACEQEKSPTRDRMVVCLNDEYVATYRWEINWNNGWVTVQLEDGSILPTPYGKWCLANYANDYFEIERSQIKVDDPEKGM